MYVADKKRFAKIRMSNVRKQKYVWKEYEGILLALWRLFFGGSPTCDLALGGVRLPSRSCSGLHGPKGPK